MSKINNIKQRNNIRVHCFADNLRPMRTIQKLPSKLQKDPKANNLGRNPAQHLYPPPPPPYPLTCPGKLIEIIQSYQISGYFKLIENYLDNLLLILLSHHHSNKIIKIKHSRQRTSLIRTMIQIVCLFLFFYYTSVCVILMFNIKQDMQVCYRNNYILIQFSINKI